MSELTTTLSEAFDTANEQGTPTFEPLPKGSYVASITDAKVGQLKSGKGQAVNLIWEIEGGEHDAPLQKVDGAPKIIKFSEILHGVLNF